MAARKRENWIEGTLETLGEERQNGPCWPPSTGERATRVHLHRPVGKRDVDMLSPD